MPTVSRLASLSRRRFLEFLAASPVWAATGRVLAEEGPRQLQALIDNPRQALDVFDFEPVARKNLPAAHYGYLASGVDDEVTLRANREGFLKFQLTPRRLVDVSRVDMSVDILGTRYPSPIVIAPTGSNRAFHPEGEIAVAKAAKAGNHLQVLSTVATVSIVEATVARGAPVWFQLYATDRLEVGEALARRADAAGCPVIVITVDVVTRQNWETLYRLQRTDTRPCQTCHAGGMQGFLARRPSFDDIDVAGVTTTATPSLTWEWIKRLRGLIKAKLVVKGIVAAEDARAAAEIGLDGLIVSNHGGRADDNGRSTIEALPEILEAVAGRMPVLIDSGFRRGTDIAKALCLGATAVAVGRPYLWGLGAFGLPGVERVLEILRTETRMAMQQLGAPTIKDLTPAMVRRA